ncbi:hypothetical protein MKK67_12510 [Methylobacterium sp. J-072]|nr:hypothetical protein [Methylobacterium sp. J-072]
MQAQTVRGRQGGQGARVDQHLDRTFGTREDRRHAPVEEPLIAEHRRRAERVARAREAEVAAFSLPTAADACQHGEAVVVEGAQPKLGPDGEKCRGARIEAAEQQRVDLAAACRRLLCEDRRGRQSS